MIIKPANKKLGQHFITSNEIAEQIISAAGNVCGSNVLEIGPGYGILTKCILNQKPRCLIAVERDQFLIAEHQDLVDKNPGIYSIVEGDALMINEQQLIQQPIKVIANLPYNISSILLLKWLDKHELFTDFTLMFQKEVADRIAAQPGNKNYGTLSVLTQLLCDVQKVLEFKPEIFTPPPKVDSTVLKITPYPRMKYDVSIKSLKKLLKITFAQRRKMLHSSLKQITSQPIKEVLQAVNISPHDRVENLSIEQLCHLTNKLYPPIK